MERALFLVPPTGAYIREDRCQSATAGLLLHTIREPADLAICAAVLESAGWECSILDAQAEGLPRRAALERIRSRAPRLIVIQTTVPSLAGDAGFVREVRRELSSVEVAAWGADFDLAPGSSLESLPEFDAILYERPEDSLSRFAAAGAWDTVPGAAWRREGAVRVNSASPVAPSLDPEIRPARHLLDHGLYTRSDTGAPQAVVVAGRGCPFECSYCLAPRKSGRRVWLREPGSVVRELRDCVERFGISDFLLHADTFTVDRGWVRSLCRGIVDSGLRVRWVCNSRADTVDPELLGWMRGAGCWGVSLGLESGSDETLRLARKGHTVSQSARAVRLLRDRGILSLGYLMIGFPWEDEGRILRSFEGLLRVDPDLLEITFPAPFPGTALRRDLERSGMTVDERGIAGAYSLPAIAGGPVPAGRLLALRRELLNRFYCRPRAAARCIGHFGRAGSLRGLARAAWRLIDNGWRGLYR
ncbi:MAG: radical SAM protein [Elusimicrobia bacterium]|nr:radical SAM protein [Elusimicrobiota bacterium]